MDKKYEELGDNPGLKYPIFTKYRKDILKPENCAKAGMYPENKRLQKLVSEEEEISNKWGFKSDEEKKKLKYLEKEIEKEREKNEKLMKKW